MRFRVGFGRKTGGVQGARGRLTSLRDVAVGVVDVVKGVGVYHVGLEIEDPVLRTAEGDHVAEQLVAGQRLFTSEKDEFGARSREGDVDASSVFEQLADYTVLVAADAGDEHDFFVSTLELVCSMELYACGSG